MRKVWVLAGVTFGLVAAALYLAGRETPPIRIGILHSTSGTMALSELPLIDAAQLAVAEINREGGVLGRRLEAVVADGQSDPEAFAAAAERLIGENGVSALFGTWTSASRKAVKAVVEREDHLLFYPLQYEGLEQSPNIIYLGAVPNQQIMPAVRWALFNLGPRFYLVGSDYVFPRAAHEIIRTQLARWPAGVVGETYVPLGSPDVGEAIRGIVETKPDVILSTLNGDSNVAFFEALSAAGLSAETAPVVSFSVAEEELQYLPAAAMQGHYAAWSYFQSTVSGANERFLARFRDRYGAARVTSDPIETAYVAVRLYADAVAAAGSDDPARVREALADRSFSGPGGLIHVDGRTRHTWKTMRIGRIRDDGQFDIVWTSGLPVAPLPFPALRPEQEWTAFLDRLQAGWGGGWEPPARP